MSTQTSLKILLVPKREDGSRDNDVISGIRDIDVISVNRKSPPKVKQYNQSRGFESSSFIINNERIRKSK